MLLEIRKRLEELGLPYPLRSPLIIAVRSEDLFTSSWPKRCRMLGCLPFYDTVKSISLNEVNYLSQLTIYHAGMVRLSLVGLEIRTAKKCSADIRNAIIKTPAQKSRPATYWSQPEQEIKIVEAYNKWLQYGGIWSAAAPKVRGVFLLTITGLKLSSS